MGGEHGEVCGCYIRLSLASCYVILSLRSIRELATMSLAIDRSPTGPPSLAKTRHTQLSLRCFIRGIELHLPARTIDIPHIYLYGCARYSQPPFDIFLYL